MSDPFAKVDVSRRTFVQQLATGAFAAPALLSFSAGPAAAQASATPFPSQSHTPTPTGTTTPTPSPSLAPPTPSGPVVVPFDDFIARGDVELKPGLNNDQFTVTGRFMLGAASDGIDPVHEDVVITLGPASWTIPAGSFREDRHGNSRRARYTFDGTIGTTHLEVEITQRPDGSFQLKVKGRNAELTGITNPAPFSLRIGNDGGATLILLDDDDD